MDKKWMDMETFDIYVGNSKKHSCQYADMQYKAVWMYDFGILSPLVAQMFPQYKYNINNTSTEEPFAIWLMLSTTQIIASQTV